VRTIQAGLAYLGTVEVELVETGADSTESQTKGLSVCERSRVSDESRTVDSAELLTGKVTLIDNRPSASDYATKNTNEPTRQRKRCERNGDAPLMKEYW